MIFYMNKILLTSLFFVIFIIIIRPHNQEGFNTYFRQTVRPHIRSITDAREIITYHFNTKFKDFGRMFGFR